MEDARDKLVGVVDDLLVIGAVMWKARKDEAAVNARLHRALDDLLDVRAKLTKMLKHGENCKDGNEVGEGDDAHAAGV